MGRARHHESVTGEDYREDHPKSERREFRKDRREARKEARKAPESKDIAKYSNKKEKTIAKTRAEIGVLWNQVAKENLQFHKELAKRYADTLKTIDGLVAELKETPNEPTAEKEMDTALKTLRATARQLREVVRRHIDFRVNEEKGLEDLKDHLQHLKELGLIENVEEYVPEGTPPEETPAQPPSDGAAGGTPPTVPTTPSDGGGAAGTDGGKTDTPPEDTEDEEDDKDKTPPPAVTDGGGTMPGPGPVETPPVEPVTGGGDVEPVTGGGDVEPPPIIVTDDDGDGDVEPPPPEPSTREVAEINLAISQILPEYSEWLYLNPRTHWFDYTDAFYKLPVDKQRSLQERISVQLNGQLSQDIKNGLDARIAAETDPAQKSLLEGVKILTDSTAARGMPEIAQARGKLKAGGAEGAEILKDMNHDFERVRQGQLLAMFETTEASKHEAITDDWAVSKWFSDKDEIGQARINLVHKVSPAIQEVMEGNPDGFKSVQEVIDRMKINTALRKTPTQTITEQEVKDFEALWNGFLANEGAPLVAVDVTQDNFLEQFSDASQKQWLEVAKTLRKEGQYEQAEEILRSILLGGKTAAGLEVGFALLSDPRLVAKQNEIMADLQRQIRDDQVQENLENQGLLTDAGLASLGLYDEATSQYIDSNGGPINRIQAITILVGIVKTQTINSLAQKQLLWEAAGLGVLDSNAFTTVEKEALDVYKDMQGVGTWDLSDSAIDAWTTELAINVGLLAASAAGGAGAVVLAGRLGLRVRGVLAAASASRAGTALVRGGRLENTVAPFLARSVVGGTGFQLTHTASSMFIVGKDAWNEFGTGLKHSIGMYMVFGAGNAAWNRGMRALETRYGGRMMGRFGQRAQVESIVAAFRNSRAASGTRGRATLEMLKTLGAKQPAMVIEAFALTGVTHGFDVNGLEEGNFWENVGKNFVTLNLLWVAPKPGRAPEPTPKPKGPRQIETVEGKLDRLGVKQKEFELQPPKEGETAREWVAPKKEGGKEPLPAEPSSVERSLIEVGLKDSIPAFRAQIDHVMARLEPIHEGSTKIINIPVMKGGRKAVQTLLRSHARSQEAPATYEVNVLFLAESPKLIEMKNEVANFKAENPNLRINVVELKGMPEPYLEWLVEKGKAPDGEGKPKESTAAEPAASGEAEKPIAPPPVPELPTSGGG